MANASPSNLHDRTPTRSTYIHETGNIILPDLKRVQSSTTSTTNPDFLKAEIVSFPPRPHFGHRVPTTENKIDSVFEGEGEDGSSRGMMMVKHDGESHMKDAKIKYGVIDESRRELKGLSVIYVKGEEVDLDFLARVADGAYEKELASMTEGMSRAHLIGFMESLEGEWCGRSVRRKVVDAAEFVKALPINWKIELSLRRRAGLRSIYCRRYVSPSGEHFKSCKDAAIYLRNQSLTDVDSPFEQGQMRQINNSCHALPKSEVNGVEEDVDLSTYELYDVKVLTLIECTPCGVVFKEMRGLERHLATVHKETTRRFRLPTGPCDSQKVTDPCQHADMYLDDEPVHVSKERFKTKCTWCNKEFVFEPLDMKSMEDASEFMCSQCKDKLCGVFERSLVKSYKH
ncbi:hypothetical protein LXL04_038633 [Taraxacum kok-saghyz]